MYFHKHRQTTNIQHYKLDMVSGYLCKLNMLYHKVDRYSMYHWQYFNSNCLGKPVDSSSLRDMQCRILLKYRPCKSLKNLHKKYKMENIEYNSLDYLSRKFLLDRDCNKCIPTMRSPNLSGTHNNRSE